MTDVFESYWSYCPVCDGFHRAGRVAEWKPCWLSSTGLRWWRFRTGVSSRGEDLVANMVREELLKLRGVPVEPSADEMVFFKKAMENWGTRYNEDGTPK